MMLRLPSTPLSLALLAVAHLQPAAAQSNPAGTSLFELSLEELADIVVTSVTKEPVEARQTPSAIYVLTANDIARSGATNLPEALRLVPGVQVSRIDANHWAVAIRGLAGQFSQSLLVLIDGRNVYTPLFAGVYWNYHDLPLEDVERIEVIRGPGGTIWGTNAVNGVINVITRNAEQSRGLLASLTAGTLDETIGTLRYGGQREDFAYRIFARSATRGPVSYPGQPAFDEWELSQIGFRADWQLSDETTLQIDGRTYSGEDGQLVDIGVYDPPAQVRTVDSQDFEGTHVGAVYHRALAPESDLRLAFFFDSTDRMGQQYGERRETFDLDALHTVALRRQTLRWGVGVRHSPGDFRKTVPTITFAPLEQVERVWSLYAQDEIPFAGDRARLFLGAKFEHNRYTGWETQPSIRAIFEPDSAQTFWGGASRAVRIPSRVDRDLLLTGNVAPTPPLFLRIAGSPSFRGETLNALELGYRRLFGTKLYLDIASFANRHDDLAGVDGPLIYAESVPPPTRTVVEYRYTNAVQGDGWGVEIAPTWQPTNWLELKAGYSYLDLELESAPEFANSANVANARQLSLSSPQHQLFVQSTFRLPGDFEMTAIARASSELAGQQVDAYETLDLNLTWAISRKLRLSLVGQNLLDDDHAEFGGTPGRLGVPRSAYLRMTWQE